jgi:hypothetical protein
VVARIRGTSLRYDAAMVRSLVLVVACLSLASGCTEKPGAAAATSGEPGTRAGEKPSPYTPSAPLPKIEVTAPTTGCVALPTLGAGATEAQRGLVGHAAAIRRLACEPALYTRTTAELAAELGLPAEAELGFDGPRTARLTLPKGVTVGDLAVALGIAAPQVKLSWSAYHPVTRLGNDPTSGDLDLFAPGAVRIDVDFEVDRYAKDAGVEKVIAAPRDTLVGRGVQIEMSSAAVKVVGDDDAAALVVSALAQIAASPEILGLKPDEARARLGLGDERYRVSEVSIHGEEVVRGLGINPQRTVLPAAALAAGLGLDDAEATNVNREHNKWSMKAGGTTRILWRGLELGIHLDVERTESKNVPLAGLEVSFMSIYAARP